MIICSQNMKTLSGVEYQTALFSLIHALRKNNALYGAPEVDVINGELYLMKFIGTNYQDLFIQRYLSALRNQIQYKTIKAKKEWNKQCDTD
ncbi:TPA: hypothetical protein NV758_001536 [Escherichia coli]|uniref:Uncharacterized protein n=1 Tax=Escherichia phage SP27 TaxID=2495557 RepID=A0A5A4U335_9CAUD|nr:hypothetical protein EO157G_3000 [Escherichia phage SP27]HBB3760800.1 hypothetical protein [Escherichia coli]HCJ8666521.1 hypothetical protein [Escherichia coli]